MSCKNIGVFIFRNLLFAFAVMPYCTIAQYVDYGSDPARLRWFQIKTDNYKVIYPAEYEVQATIYANLLENVYPHVRNTMSSKRKSLVPVVFHPYSVIPNGMVAWAPKRMEMLPAPNFSSRFQIPELSLSVHESRHVAQMERLNQGLFRPFYFIFGEQTAGVSGIVPKWLLEGDAVVAETALSLSGRGREASFLMPYRAQIATGNNFSLDKWFLGSYKDYTHDFYALGYGMSAHARLNYGADVWNKVLDKTTKIPFFALSLKKHTGLTPKKLFAQTFDFLQTDWNSLEPENVDKLTYITQNSKSYTSYLNPLPVGSGVVSLKKGIEDIPAIVFIDSAGNEKHIAYVGAINSKLTLFNNFVYWSEYTPGIRWTHENYSVVKRLDIKTKKIEQISRKSRYFIPTVMQTGQIAVFEHQPDGRNNIMIIDTLGNQLRKYPIVYNMLVQDMAAGSNNSLFLSATSLGNAIFKLNTATAVWEGVLSYNRTNIESLWFHNGNLLFESGYNGVNNIYSFDTLALSVSRLTNARFGYSAGVFLPNGKLIVSDYSAKGYKLATVEILNKEDVSFKDPYKFPMAEGISAQETYNVDKQEFKIRGYESKPYRKAPNLFNVHSWFPAFLKVDEVSRSGDIDLNSFKLGATLLSQNNLNTFISQISYYHNTNDNSNHGFVSLAYKGWFPVFELKADIGGRRGFYNFFDDGSIIRDFGKEIRVKTEASVYVPLSFSRGSYNHGLQPFLSYVYQNDVLPEVGQDFQYINGGVYYHNYRNLAHRDIFPKYGLQLWLRYVGQPDIKTGQLYIAKGNAYLPGLFQNHGVRLSGSYQHQNVQNGQYFFPLSFADISRGNRYYLQTQNLYTIKGDYSFPISYPDLSVGSLLYLQRVRANVFYDCTNAHVLLRHNEHVWLKQQSYGLDILLDLHFLRLQYAPSTIMFRFLKPERDNMMLSFSVGVNI